MATFPDLIWVHFRRLTHPLVKVIGPEIWAEQHTKKSFVWYICHAQCLLMGDIAPLVHFLEMLACHISVCWSCIFATTKCPASFAMACQTVWVWSAIACQMLYCSPDLEGSCMVYSTALEDWTHCLLLPPSWSRFDKGLMFELWTFFSSN